MQIGPFYFVVVSRQNNQPQHVSDPSIYLDAVARLATALEGMRWMLVAGLAIPLTLGRFYREHRDLDVGIAEQDLAAAQRALRHAGYVTVTRLGMFGLGHRRKLEIYLRCGVGSWLLRLRPRNIRCFSAAEPLSAGDGALMKWIDLYLYREREGVLEILDRGIRVPMDQPLIGRTLEFGGRSVQVIHLHYVDHVKSKLRCKTHRLDRSVIAHGIDKACAEFKEWAPPEISACRPSGNGHVAAASQRPARTADAPAGAITLTKM